MYKYYNFQPKTIRLSFLAIRWYRPLLLIYRDMSVSRAELSIIEDKGFIYIIFI